jgi:uncharacterized membrane protein
MAEQPPPLPDPDDLPRERVDYESTSLERSSYITAIVHLYRGEVSRANTWRSRLDQTTHWSIFVTASTLGFAFGQEGANHFSVLFGHLLIVILLVLEARRFRFFDVWRSRIRKIENNFFAPILERRLMSPQEHWGMLVAQDLAEPHFHLTRLEAISLRLRRNYLPLFLVLLLAWLIKLIVHPEPLHNLSELYDRCAVGHIPGWFALSLVTGFYAALVWVLVRGRTERMGRDDWEIKEKVEEYR